MANANGIVRDIARNGKAFRLVGESDDAWYSCFDISNMGKTEVGADVTFKYTTKPGQGGKMWHNVQGPVQVINPGPGAGAHPTTRPGAPAATTFGGVHLSRERSIARQNACNVMAGFLGKQLAIDPTSFDDNEVRRIARLVVTGAEVIEAYTTGDDDRDEAEEKLRVKTIFTEAGNVLDEFDES